jgi:hypothetical protein
MNLRLKFRILETFGSQVNFAHELRLSEPYVSRVVRNHKSLELCQWERWAKTLGCKPEDIWNYHNALVKDGQRYGNARSWR